MNIGVVLRTMAGETLPAPKAHRLAKCTEPTIRAVIQTQLEHHPVLRETAPKLEAFFREAARNCEPERVSKRRRAGE